jgi:HK97 gp10 family phage protein
MATSADFELKGVKELTRNLGRFERKVKNQAVKEAVVAGSEVIKKAFETDAPQDTGHLKRNIGIRFKKYSNNSVGIIGGKSLKELPVKDNTGVYFYILNFKRNVDKMHYLWANKSFNRVKQLARGAVIASLKRSVQKTARQVAQ